MGLDSTATGSRSGHSQGRRTNRDHNQAATMLLGIGGGLQAAAGTPALADGETVLTLRVARQHGISGG